jgi:hypothetical protein
MPLEEVLVQIEAGQVCYPSLPTYQMLEEQGARPTWAKRKTGKFKEYTLVA